jgi:hypothetical protein
MSIRANLAGLDLPRKAFLTWASSLPIAFFCGKLEGLDVH